MLKCLIADDNPVNLMMIQKLVDSLQVFSTDIAEDINTEYNLIEEKDYDLLMFDWHMPDKDSTDFIKDLRESGRYKKQVIILFSADEVDEDGIMKASDIGADAFLEKPITKEKLNKILQRHRYL